MAVSSGPLFSIHLEWKKHVAAGINVSSFRRAIPSWRFGYLNPRAIPPVKLIEFIIKIPNSWTKRQVFEILRAPHCLAKLRNRPINSPAGQAQSSRQPRRRRFCAFLIRAVTFDSSGVRAFDLALCCLETGGPDEGRSHFRMELSNCLSKAFFRVLESCKNRERSGGVGLGNAQGEGRQPPRSRSV